MGGRGASLPRHHTWHAPIPISDFEWSSMADVGQSNRSNGNFHADMVLYVHPVIRVQGVNGASEDADFGTRAVHLR